MTRRVRYFHHELSATTVTLEHTFYAKSIHATSDLVCVSWKRLVLQSTVKIDRSLNHSTRLKTTILTTFSNLHTWITRIHLATLNPCTSSKRTIWHVERHRHGRAGRVGEEEEGGRRRRRIAFTRQGIPFFTRRARELAATVTRSLIKSKTNPDRHVTTARANDSSLRSHCSY